MSIFSRLFAKKREDYGRTSGIERFERKVTRPIIFMTEHGGSYPLEFDEYTKEAAMMKEEGALYLNKALGAGIINEYSDISYIYDIVHQNSIINQNNLKNQMLRRKEVGNNIKMVAQEALCQEERELAQLKAERKLLKGIAEYKEMREISHDEKGLR